MNDHIQIDQQPFLKSRIGIGLILFLAIAGFLLLFEHRAHILGDYFLGGLLLFCVLIHVFMHGGHGGHGDHGKRTLRDDGEGR